MRFDCCRFSGIRHEMDLLGVRHSLIIPSALPVRNSSLTGEYEIALTSLEPPRTDISERPVSDSRTVMLPFREPAIKKSESFENVSAPVQPAFVGYIQRFPGLSALQFSTLPSGKETPTYLPSGDVAKEITGPARPSCFQFVAPVLALESATDLSKEAVTTRFPPERNPTDETYPLWTFLDHNSFPSERRNIITSPRSKAIA